MSTSGNANARASAAHILRDWLKTRHYPEHLIPDGIPDRAMVAELVYGVVRWKRRLEWLAGECADGKIGAPALPYLLVGLYQLFFLDHVPAHAAINETVNAAKAELPKAAVGFINAVLRRAQREAGSLDVRLRDQPSGVQLSHPDRLVKRWVRSFGRERTEALCRWNNERPLTTCTPNTNRVDLESLCRQFREAQIKVEPHPFAPDRFLVLPHGTPVPALPGLDRGLFSIQDPATTLAVDMLDPRPGDRILDACAAPGGKTFLMANRTNGQALIRAVDVQKDRLARLNENIARWQLQGVKTCPADASDTEDLKRQLGHDPFDRILLDVPCTNTGVLRRRPDARWRFNDSRRRHIQATQRALLDAVAPLLAPTGLLVYSTCSLEPEENEEMIISWLADHPDFECRGLERLFPPDTQTDGMVAAALQHKRSLS